mgnify:CR=1 FL=1
MDVLIPEEKESVLLGAAMLGMAASQDRDLASVTASLSSSVTRLRPDKAEAGFQEAKYRVFREMLRDQIKYRTIMEEFTK